MGKKIHELLVHFVTSNDSDLQFSSVQFSCSVASDSATPWTAAPQASLSITNSWSWFKLMSIESVMPSNHLILCCPLLLPPSIFLSIRVFSNESVLRIRWPKYWSFSFSISPSNEYSGPSSLSTLKECDSGQISLGLQKVRSWKSKIWDNTKGPLESIMSN